MKAHVYKGDRTANMQVTQVTTGCCGVMSVDLSAEENSKLPDTHAHNTRNLLAAHRLCVELTAQQLSVCSPAVNCISSSISQTALPYGMHCHVCTGNLEQKHASPPTIHTCARSSCHRIIPMYSSQPPITAVIACSALQHQYGRIVTAL